MNKIQLTLAAAAVAAACATTASAYDVAVKSTDGQVFRATVDDLEKIDFNSGVDPITFTGAETNEIVVGNDAQDVTVRFDASMYWIVSQADEDGWCRLSRHYGLGGENVLTLSLDASPVTWPRTFHFTVMCGFQTIEFSVTQDDNQAGRYVDIPDDVFRKYILDNFDSDGDGRISIAEAAKVKEIHCNSMKIKSMAGVRQFPNLEVLECAYNEIADVLDISGLKKLRTAFVGRNLYKTLNASGCVALEDIDCASNVGYVDYSPVFFLETVDLSGCTELRSARLEDNGIKKVNLDGLSKLTDLMLAVNQLSEIDLSPCVSLRNAHLRRNNFKNFTIDATCCPELVNIFLSDSKAAGLKVAGLKNLRQIGASYCELTELDVAGCSALESIEAFGNKIPKIDVSGCPDLKTLWLTWNNLTAIDVASNPRLETLQMGSNNITGTIDLTKNPNLTFVDFNKNPIDGVKFCDGGVSESIILNNCPNLKTLDVSKLIGLVTLVANNSALTEVNIGEQTSLFVLDLEVNQLKSLDLSGCPMVQELVLNDNQIENLDLEPCKNLKEFYVSNNGMKSLKMTGLSAVATVEAYDNLLTSIDFTGCVAIDQLHIHRNRLTAFDPSPITALRYVDCRDNEITTIDFSKNHALQYAFGTGNPCTTVYLSSQAPNSKIEFDADCKIYVK